MANQIQDNLYRVALDSERSFVYVSAKDKTDLIKFLAQEYAGKHEVFGVKEVGKDGSLTPVQVITDELYQNLLAMHEPQPPRTEFGAFLRQLQQQGPYQWPNRYFAWEKPDNSIFMVGIVSGQANHILVYEQRSYLGREPEYGGLYYCISPNATYVRSGGISYDPVTELDSKVSEFRYLGTWDDPDRFMESPNSYSRTLACGRWALALSHIQGGERHPSLDDRISKAGERTSKAAGEGGAQHDRSR